MKKKVHPKIREIAAKVRGKRARAVIDFIMKHGVVTTGDIEKMGYLHPPRAVRDVRENGIPIETIRVKGENGKNIAAYRFGNYDDIQNFKLGGRSVFSKNFKNDLYKKQQGKCAICDAKYDKKVFQIDHRIPYEFSGDGDELFKLSDFMLLCAECNRKKARATEIGCTKTCFKSGDPNIVKTCFWASPENYTHICMDPIRRVELVWSGKEVENYDSLKKEAIKTKIPLNDLIKKKLELGEE